MGRPRKQPEITIPPELLEPAPASPRISPRTWMRLGGCLILAYLLCILFAVNFTFAVDSRFGRIWATVEIGNRGITISEWGT